MLFLLLQNVSRRDEHSSRLHKPPQHQSLFFEAEKVLLQQQRTRTPGPRRVCCQRQERAQQARSSLSVPGSAEGQSPDLMGAAGPLGYNKSHGTLLTTYSTVLDAQMPAHTCSASGLLFHNWFSWWARVQPGVCVRPSPSSTWGWSPPPGNSLCLLPQGKRLGRRFQWFPWAVLDIILLHSLQHKDHLHILGLFESSGRHAPMLGQITFTWGAPL